jgi:hypothetical protein
MNRERKSGGELDEKQVCNNLQQMMRTVAFDQHPTFFSIEHPALLLTPACRVKTKFFHFSP